MAINFGLAGDSFDALQVLQAYGQAQTQKLTQMRLAREQQSSRRMEASRPRVQERIAARDYTGAQTAAIEGGDYDAAKAIGSLSDDHRKQAAEQADVMGSIATSLKSVPVEQRGAAFQAALPALRARGFSDQELQGVDLSDASLDGYAASALSVKDALAAHTKANEQYTLAPGSARYDATGKLIVEQPFAPRPVSVSPGETVIEYQPGKARGGDTAAITGDQVERLALATVPGAQVTSRTRTPEHNREVGGKPNSYHLTGQARDLVPPQGMTMAQFDRTIRPTMEAQGLKVINEGDHIHIQPSQRGGGGPRVIAQGAPKVAAEDRAPSGYRWAGGNLEPIPGGPGDKQGRQANLKPIPSTVVKGIIENRGTLRQIDQAISAINRRPQSIGVGTGALGDQFTQYNDPDGTTTRAAVGKIAGQIIHDVSGAAVTLSEEPRFKPYVPVVTDSPQVAIAKLKQLRRLAADTLDDVQGFYSEEQGYKPFSTGRKVPAATPATLPKGWKVKVVN